MSLNSPTLSKSCSYDEFAQEVTNTLYAVWFGLKSHSQFDGLSHPIMFITNIDEDRAFGFVVTRMNPKTKTLTLRAQHVSNTNLREFLESDSVSIISGDIAPTLIKLSD